MEFFIERLMLSLNREPSVRLWAGQGHGIPNKKGIFIMKIRAVVWAVFFLTICHLKAQIQNVQVVGTTATQAVLSYTAPSASPCQVEVGTDSSYAPLVNDVQPALFPGSNLDNRDGSVTIGLYREYVVGRRTAEVAADGKRYSRALQADTEHFFRITCGTVTATGSFHTSNIPLGQAFNDPLPVDPSHPGQYAWPTLSATDRTQSIIDPQTGLLIKRLSIVGDRYNIRNDAFKNALDPTSTWQNPSNVLADDSDAATVSGSQQPLFVNVPISTTNGAWPHGDNHSTNLSGLDWVKIPVLNAWYGSGSGADLIVQIALTVDGVTPATNWIDQTLAVCTSGCANGNRYEIGDTTPVLAAWTGGLPPTFDGTDVVQRTGKVNTSDTTVTRVSGSDFDLHWGAGSTITINGVPYTIAGLTNKDSITLTTSAGTQNGVAYSASNFGILVRKNTASADTLSVQYAGFSWERSDFPSWDPSGDEEVYVNCSNAQVSGPGGEMGFHCIVGGTLYWIGDTSGTANRIGPVRFPARSGTDGWNAFMANVRGVFWDKTEGNSLYTSTTDTAGNTIIIKAAYNGDNSDIGNWQYNAYNATGTNLVECGTAPCWTLTNITPASTGMSLSQLLGAFSPDYASWAQSGQIVITDFSADNFTLQSKIKSAPSNDYNCFWAIYSPTAQNIVAAIPSWKYWPNRWASCHGPVNLNDPSYYKVSGEGYTSARWSGSNANGQGPYRALVTSGAIPAEGQACPAVSDYRVPSPPAPGSLNCLQITLDGAPCDPTPGPDEPADGGAHCGNPAEFYLQDLAPGDYGCIVNDPTSRTNSANLSGCNNYYEQSAGDPDGAEFFRVLAVSGNTITLQRGWYGPSHTVPWLAKNAGASWVTIPSTCNFDFPYACTNAHAYWNFGADPLGKNGMTVVDVGNKGGGHSVQRPGLQVGSVSSLCPGLDGLANGCYNVRRAPFPDIFAAPNYTISNNPSFNGRTGEGQPNNVDSHPSYSQYPLASGQELAWFTDARPFLGDNFLTGTSSNPAQLISGTLYKLSDSQLPRFRPRQMPTLAACGANPLLNISGPSSSITDGAADNYKYCVANAAGECTPSSAQGDVYVNCPYISTPYCPYMGVGILNADLRGICIADNGGRTQGLTQVGFATADPLGNYSRVLTHALSRYFWIDQFWNAKTTPDGKWLLFRTPWADGVRGQAFVAKIPPYPPADTVNRTDFQLIPIGVAPPTTLAVDNAVVEFGYNSNFFCTSRKDPCVRGNQGGTVYAFASENPAGMPCTTGCTISIPAISQRVLYYSVIYRDAQNNILLQSGPGVVTVP
jgi:hypothetical protein